MALFAVEMWQLRDIQVMYIQKTEIQPVIQQRFSYFIPAQINHILLTIQDLPRPNYYVSDPLYIAPYPHQYTSTNSQTISHNTLFLLCCTPPRKTCSELISQASILSCLQNSSNIIF